VDRALILETTFLIDLERELAGDAGPGPAQQFLERHADHRLFVTPVVAGELAAGPSPGDRERWRRMLAPFRVLDTTLEVCWEYGRAFRYLKDNGLLIGANDLWIAAVGLAYHLPVVTRNVRHFQRVPGLEVIGY
jgi:tRNA(fMet)-specific endonuclease VapC